MNESKHILIVDDDRHVLFVLRASLAKLGDRYRVITATDGRSALEQLQTGPCDLLITDIRLPGLSGLELTVEARRLDLVPIVIWITAFGCPRLADDARRLGVFRCLDKPIEITVIREVVAKGLAATKGE